MDLLKETTPVKGLGPEFRHFEVELAHDVTQNPSIPANPRDFPTERLLLPKRGNSNCQTDLVICYLSYLHPGVLRFHLRERGRKRENSTKTFEKQFSAKTFEKTPSCGLNLSHEIQPYIKSVLG